LVSLAIIGFVVFLIFQVMGFISPASLEVIKPTEDGQVTTRELVFLGKTDSGSEVFINEQQIAIDANGGFKEEVFLKDGNNTIQLKAVNKAGKQTVKTYNFYAKLPKKTTAADTSKTEVKKELDIKIKILKNSSWIKVVVDDQVKYQGVMLENAEQSFTAKKDITISTGNAGVTDIFVNGKDKGVVGKEGEVKKNVKYVVE
jgi:hypothetical protein